MTRYRIYTERKKNLAKIASKYFHAFAIYNTVGYWKGKAEKGAIIEVIANGKEMASRLLINEINATNKQECCLLTKEIIESKLI